MFSFELREDVGPPDMACILLPWFHENWRESLQDNKRKEEETAYPPHTAFNYSFQTIFDIVNWKTYTV